MPSRPPPQALWASTAKPTAHCHLSFSSREAPAQGSWMSEAEQDPENQDPESEPREPGCTLRGEGRGGFLAQLKEPTVST